ncbi:MAG: biotin--[acetyl-CoA-carboxylase] ligase [Bdellovibrionales bacterium CG10_big_fil_rev_8_21_14_0_10_45_34]|nr:MAG: biotin--[acetyl-CoA-carboxylase] ligase [Bdellovibrionales bacterium CG10_big_fil_rev_8_21_14_0_10_45_34]
MPSKTFKIGECARGWSASINVPVVYFDEVDSTNSWAKEVEHWESLPALVITEFQTNGRGRSGRSWISPAKGTSLLSTWVFELDRAPQPIASPLVGLALYRAALTTWPKLPWSLKAPNDLYLGEKKIAGVLVEVTNTSDRWMLYVGIGMNVIESPGSKVEGSSTCLLEFLPQPLTHEAFENFLTSLIVELGEALGNSFESEMSSSCRTDLLDALNKLPLLSEPYLEILGDGSLRSASGVRGWESL